MKNAITTISLFICSGPFIGCATSSEMEPQIIDEVGPTFVNLDESATHIKLLMRNGQLLLEGNDTPSVAPGVWKHGAQRLIVGSEGHRTAISMEVANLARLHDLGASEAEIRASESVLSLLRDALASIKEEDPSTLVTCNVTFVQGPSSPFTGRTGVIAMTEISCTGGHAAFTVQAQACANGICSPVYSFSNSLVGSGWGAGTRIDAAAGLPCSAANSASPSGGSSTWNGSCG